MDNLPIMNDSQKLFQLLMKFATARSFNDMSILSDRYTEEEKEFMRAVETKIGNKKK